MDLDNRRGHRHVRARRGRGAGDTSTAYAGALAAHAGGVSLAHVEAGLRTAHPCRPFPEELFRRRIAPLAALHFAPTPLAAVNLINDGITSAKIHVCGNTIIDLLREQCEVNADFEPQGMNRGARPKETATAALRTSRQQPLPFDTQAPFGDGRAGERIATLLLDALTESASASLGAYIQPRHRSKCYGADAA